MIRANAKFLEGPSSERIAMSIHMFPTDLQLYGLMRESRVLPKEAVFLDSFVKSHHGDSGPAQPSSLSSGSGLGHRLCAVEKGSFTNPWGQLKPPLQPSLPSSED